MMHYNTQQQSVNHLIWLPPSALVLLHEPRRLGPGGLLGHLVLGVLVATLPATEREHRRIMNDRLPAPKAHSMGCHRSPQ